MSNSLDQFEKQAMWELHGKKCFYCRESLAFKNVHIDHVIPQKGFEDNEASLRKRYCLDDSFQFNGLDNFVPSCQSCNSARKGSKELENGIPLWLNEIKSLKQKVITLAAKLKNKLTFDLPDEYKEFFLTSPDFLLADLSLEEIRKKDIPLYKKLVFDSRYYPLHLTSPDDPKKKVRVNSLAEYEKYADLGYYGYTTPEIALQSVCDACLFLFKKLEEAIPVRHTLELKDYYRTLPANILHVIGPEEDFDYKNYSTIGDYIDANDDVSVELSDSKINIVIGLSLHHGHEFYLFKEVLQADFTGNGNNESIIFVHYKSGGTLNFSFVVHATYSDDKLILLKPEN